MPKIEHIKFREAIQVDGWVGNNMFPWADRNRVPIEVDYACRVVRIGAVTVPFENVVSFRESPEDFEFGKTVARVPEPKGIPIETRTREELKELYPAAPKGKRK